MNTRHMKWIAQEGHISSLFLRMIIQINRDLWRCESAFRPKVSVFRNRRGFRKRRLIRVSSCEVGDEADFFKKSIDSKQFTLYTIGRSSDGKEKAKWQKENYR